MKGGNRERARGGEVIGVACPSDVKGEGVRERGRLWRREGGGRRTPRRFITLRRGGFLGTAVWPSLDSTRPCFLGRRKVSLASPACSCRGASGCRRRVLRRDLGEGGEPRVCVGVKSRSPFIPVSLSVLVWFLPRLLSVSQCIRSVLSSYLFCPFPSSFSLSVPCSFH